MPIAFRQRLPLKTVVLSTIPGMRLFAICEWTRGSSDGRGGEAVAHIFDKTTLCSLIYHYWGVPKNTVKLFALRRFSLNM